MSDMKIVVLGATGMLGHLAAGFLKEKYRSGVVLCARRKTAAAWINESLYELDLGDIQALSALITFLRPCIVVNCAAVNDVNKGADELDWINTRLPLRIATQLDEINDGSRLIHISTDGVFSGSRGQYNEDDTPDAQDLYGKSKLAGEVIHAPHLTVRTSIIGPDPFKPHGLMNWFFSQTGAVKGFTRVFWSGVTTLELVRFIDYAIEGGVSGLIHLTSGKISKYELLVLMKNVFEKHIDIQKEESVASDRSLISKRSDVAYRVPPLQEMLGQLKSRMARYPQLYK
jgi:dTDP-4-dehydrorhamnose reductase